MMKLGALWMVLLLAACTRATPVRGPDGTHGWFNITCHQDRFVDEGPAQ
jgi:hypothetical protein